MLDTLTEFDPAISWEKLHSSWLHKKHWYPELHSLARFEQIRWGSRFYWGFDQPAQLYMGEEHGGTIHLDWWPRSELEQRRQELSNNGTHWNSVQRPPAQASRYTLFYLWEAKIHTTAEEALDAVWLAACFGMWVKNLPDAWRGRFVRVLEEYRYAALGRMRHFGLGEWSHSCRYLLPDSLAGFYRKPEYDLEMMDMVAANISYVLSRWVLVQLVPDWPEPKQRRAND